MSRIPGAWLVLSVLAVAGCASTPTTPTPPPAAKAAPAAAGTTATKPDDMVCTMDVPTGSLFAKRTCMTKEERDRRAADSIRNMQRPPLPPQ